MACTDGSPKCKKALYKKTATDKKIFFGQSSGHKYLHGKPAVRLPALQQRLWNEENLLSDYNCINTLHIPDVTVIVNMI